jgi:hypothetical protein
MMVRVLIPDPVFILSDHFSAVSASFRGEERPLVQVHPEAFHRVEQQRHTALRTPVDERGENIDHDARQQVSHDHEVARLKSPYAESHEEETRDPDKQDQFMF